MTNGDVLEQAEQAAEGLRELNHRTRDPRASPGRPSSTGWGELASR